MEVRRHWPDIRAHLTPDRVEFFWSHVSRGSASECWPWTGTQNRYGYGSMMVMPHSGPIAAHRLAYGIANGGIPRSLHILHRCDNRICCNPAHLYAGTHQENMADMKAKGRAGWQRKGLCLDCGAETPTTAIKRCGRCRALLLAPIRAKREAARKAERERAKLLRRHGRAKVVFPATHAELLALLGNDARRCEAVECHFGLYGRPAETLQVVGDRLGLSRERIRQYKVAVLARLRIGAGWKYCRNAFYSEKNIERALEERGRLTA